MTWRWLVLAVALESMLVQPAGLVGAQSAPEPAPADAASLARGQEIYSQHCAICHGVQGRGDGPLARTLVPRPVDLRLHMAEGHTPAELFDWVSNGVPNTAMEGFASVLSVEDRWHVINFLQTFAPESR